LANIEHIRRDVGLMKELLEIINDSIKKTNAYGVQASININTYINVASVVFISNFRLPVFEIDGLRITYESNNNN